MLKKISLLSTALSITALCTAAQDFEDPFLQQVIAHQHGVRESEATRGRLVGSLSLRRTPWETRQHNVSQQDGKLVMTEAWGRFSDDRTPGYKPVSASDIEKVGTLPCESSFALELGLANRLDAIITARRLQENDSANKACFSELMAAYQPWHAGSTELWVAIKHRLANMVAKLAVADMRTFEKYTLENDFYACMAGATCPLMCISYTAGACCCPLAGASFCLCGFCIPLGMKSVATAQKVNHGERFYKAIDWLACDTAWQERVALDILQKKNKTN